MVGILKSDMIVTVLDPPPVDGFPILLMSISGGKDSLAMWLKLWEKKVPNLVPVYFDGGWEWPFAIDEIRRVEGITGIKSHTLDHGDLFDSVIRKRGWPTWKVRWCTGHKRDKIAVFGSSIKRGQPDFKIKHCVGFASDEKKRVLGIAKQHPGIVLPLVDYGIKERQCLKICNRYGCTWEGHYFRSDRMSCWCCPWQRVGDLGELYKYQSDYWQLLKVKDRLAPRGRKFRWGGKSIKDLEARFKKESDRGAL